jgi:hypothetical protein
MSVEGEGTVWIEPAERGFHPLRGFRIDGRKRLDSERSRD